MADWCVRELSHDLDILDISAKSLQGCLEWKEKLTDLFLKTDQKKT